MAAPSTALRTAIRAAQAAARVAMRAFGGPLVVETKADATPVTAIDRACEEAMRRVVRRDFPADGFLGEEFGARAGETEARWILDPIDGTKSYIRGMPFWGCMVAREVRGRVTAGAVALPALGRLIWAERGRGAWADGRRLRVSRRSTLDRAYVLCGGYETFVQHRAVHRMTALHRRGAVVRSPGDAPSYLWLAEGRADAVIEAGIAPWDIAAALVIVEEAGGRFTDWRGRPGFRIPNVLATNGRLHRPLQRLLTTR